MSWLEAIVLGLAQGLTEFLPISSSAHVRIVPAIAGWPDPGAAFTAVIQLGTMAAVLVYFRHDLWRIVRAFFRSLADRTLWRTADVDGRLGWYIGLGTIPVAVLGVIFSNQIEDDLRSLELIAIVMIVFSAVLWQADRKADQLGDDARDIETITPRDGIVIGLAQSLALIPGVSRSGSTISFGMFQGFTRESAARYSFLLSVPAVVLSGLFELRKVGDGSTTASAGATAIATLVAFVVGYATIAWLLRYVRTHDFEIFVIYRVVVGFLILGLALGGVIS